MHNNFRNPMDEGTYEGAIMELFETMGYVPVYAPEIERDYRDPFYEPYLIDAIKKLNSDLPESAIKEALNKLRHIESGSLIQQNEQFMNYVQNGIEISYLENGASKGGIAYLIDYKNPENNSFVVANQWTFIENSEKRADIILFINGLPLVLMELKSPSREEVGVSEAYRQIRNYMSDIPTMFVYNAICVISDLLTSKAGTITSPETRFMEWKSIDGNYEDDNPVQFETFFKGIFQKERLLDIVKNFICFSDEGVKKSKILAGYHQYFAVKKAIQRTIKATETDGKGGVFWHTQGSGKSLSMVFYAKLLQRALNSPTIVVITDRNDLDNQLYGQFSKCENFLGQRPIQATSRKHLKSLLDGVKVNGIFFTTMQKFEEFGRPLSKRRNIVVMADEAHRGQYGLGEKVTAGINESKSTDQKIIAKVSKLKAGMARTLRDNLPNATYIGFTGTPISLRDRDTRAVFGDYIDIYDMTQAVKDNATRPVYYESRVIKLKLEPKVLELIDAEYDIMANNADPEIIEKSKKELSKMEVILGNDNTINSLVSDIIEHYENCRANLLTGKAMIVAYSRAIAIKIYRKILELRPDWKKKTAVVMTAGNDDPDDWREIIGNKTYREKLADKFKDNNDPLKIVIVVDMWLTGFDVPPLATMYVYKPMVGHNLMQAIARVNRVFKDKEGGLIVDYIGITSALKQAMSEYTARDRKNYGNMDIVATALPKFQEKLEICQNLFYQFDYSKFFTGNNLVRSNVISGALNFILAQNKNKEKEAFKKESLLMHQALSLCASLVDKHQRIEAAFFEAVRVLVLKFSAKGGNKKISLPEMNERISELLKQSIKSEGVINLFSDIKQAFSLFDPKFLEEISKMKHKNLALELLKKLISEQIRIYRRTNIVKSEKFSTILQETMNKYLNGMLTNEEVIAELIKLAKEISVAHKEGKIFGLTSEELAFYDAITKPEAIKDFYENEELIAIAKELTETLQKNKTVDWYKKEPARAKMRMKIRRLLKNHKYPPEGVKDAVQTIIDQCELWTDNAMEVD